MKNLAKCFSALSASLRFKPFAVSGNLFLFTVYALIATLLYLQAGLGAYSSEPKRYEFEDIKMGVPVRIILYSDDASLAENAAKAVFEKFDALNAIMSDYDSDSELSQLTSFSSRIFDESPQNLPEQGGEGVRISVSEDLFTVLKASRHYSEISGGAFDITIAPLVRLWRRSKRQKELPTQKLLEQAKSLVGQDVWLLDEPSRTVCIKKRGVRFDLGGIAKGYAIDCAFDVIQAKGISSVLVDAGGDLRLGDAPPDSQQGWKIDLDTQEGTVLFLERIALATSGDRFRFVEIDGARYSHIIDPKTGLGLTWSSTVYVAAPTAMEADALASALSVLEPEKGMELIDATEHRAARILFHDDNRTYRSKTDLDALPNNFQYKSVGRLLSSSTP